MGVALEHAPLEERLVLFRAIGRVGLSLVEENHGGHVTAKPIKSAPQRRGLFEASKCEELPDHSSVRLVDFPRTTSRACFSLRSYLPGGSKNISRKIEAFADFRAANSGSVTNCQIASA